MAAPGSYVLVQQWCLGLGGAWRADPFEEPWVVIQ